MQIRLNHSAAGVLVGAVFFALSMTPTLVPRPGVIQGMISGLALALGYGAGAFGGWLWSYFELPAPAPKFRKPVRLIAAACGLVIAAIFLWRASGWQDFLHRLMGMEENAASRPELIAAVALAVFLALLFLARAFRAIKRFVAGKLQSFIPRRVSYMIGLLAAFMLFWMLVDGILFSSLLRLADSSYEQVDAHIEPEAEKPAEPMKTGSIESLLSWKDMGRQGRRFLSTGPSAADLRAFTQRPVRDPIRVYVGMRAAKTFEERATLALDELKRVRAFDRSVLVIITPTGTGWVDPAAIDTLEYLHRGDSAGVAAQYSYLPSPLSLLVEEEYGAEMARALFRKVYGHWTGLPADKRPRLFLHGLSLGALNSDRSFDLFDVINDPFHGALWSGPPFRTYTWRRITALRNPDSPAWLPRFRDGAVVRFANQQGGLDRADAPWGSFRIAYLQYASDPVAFFEPRSLFREPEWMKEPRGPDVSGDLRWFPVVTMLQLVADMTAGTAPAGYGHEYAAEHYVDSWLALTEPKGWSAPELARLRAFFANRQR